MNQTLTKSLDTLRYKAEIFFEHTKIHWGQPLEEPTVIHTTTDGYYDEDGYYLLEPQKVTRNIKKMYGLSIQFMFIGIIIYDSYQVQSLV